MARHIAFAVCTIIRKAHKLSSPQVHMKLNQKSTRFIQCAPIKRALNGTAKISLRVIGVNNATWKMKKMNEKATEGNSITVDLAAPEHSLGAGQVLTRAFRFVTTESSN